MEEVEKYLPIRKENWAFSSTVTVEDHLIPEELTTEFQKKNLSAPAFHPQILQKYKELGLFDFYKTTEGSNLWAISGKHTASGRPLLSHDPHLENAIPSNWYQIQAVYDHAGQKNYISGISFAGVPFVFGKTGYMAMGVTTIYMDNQDLFRETVEGNKYLVNGKWVDLKIREEKIKVKREGGIV